MIFSEKLQLLRKSKGLTQRDLAEKLNVSRQEVVKWKYSYYDTYVGGEQFAGEEIVCKSGKAVYAMNYVGRVLDQHFSGNFLKAALRAADKTLECYFHGGLMK